MSKSVFKLYAFKNPKLLQTALAHSSYANERRLQSYERLEFLGDAVLGFLCAEYLYKNCPDLPEGELTKLRAAVVCEKSLCRVAREFEIDKALLLGKGEEAAGGRARQSILADAVESVLAAFYLDGGMETARMFTDMFIPAAVDDAMRKNTFKDYKTTLQEIVQKNHQEILEYRLKEADGPDHNKRFSVELFLNSNSISVGSGKSKKEAEQNAAKIALELMGEV